MAKFFRPRVVLRLVAAALPSSSSSIRARALGAIRKAIRSAIRKAFTPHKAALGNLVHMPFTVTGAGGIDFAAWHITHGWGWLVTGVSLILLEHAIADEQ